MNPPKLPTFVYTDMFTGKTVKMKKERFSPIERFWYKAEYRKSETSDCCRKCKHHIGETKCELVSDKGDSATDVNNDYVCNNFCSIFQGSNDNDKKKRY